MITLSAPSGIQLTMATDWRGQDRGTLICEAIAGIPGSVQAQGDIVSLPRSGVIVSPVRRDGREISITGWAHFGGPDRVARVQELAEMIGSMWDDTDATGRLEYAPGDRDPRTAYVQPKPGGAWTLDDSKAYRGWLRWTLDLLAPDPRLYGPVTTSSTGLPTPGTGLKFPLAFPLDFGVPGDPGRAEFTNVGRVAVPVRLRVTGGMSEGFTLRRVETGEQISLSWPLLVSDVVSIDTDTGSCLLNGQSSLTGYMPLTDWWQIGPGERCTVQFGALGQVTGTPTLTLEAAPAVI